MYQAVFARDGGVQLPPCELDDFELVQPQQQPTNIRWKLPLMYHEGNNGVMYIWQIAFDGGELLRLHGSTTSARITKRKVVLNSTGRTLQEQALLEACNKYKNKYYAGYLPLDAKNPPQLKAMKGVPYQKGKVKKWPLLASPKLNGIRMLVQNVGSASLRCLSYLNRSYEHLQHLYPSILGILTYLPSQSVLDGELYRHGMSFHQICSAVKTTTHFHPQLQAIQYHVFDLICPENLPSESRAQLLQRAFNYWHQDICRDLQANTDNEVQQQLQFQLQAVELVPQQQVYNHEQVQQLKAFYQGHGYEGLVLRTMALDSAVGSREYQSSLYRHGRSTKLYKVKDFIDEEGTVVGVVESMGNEEGTAGLRIRDIRGNIFTVRWGEHSEREKWLQQPSLVEGKSFTFKYTELSQYGVPQQPTGVGFRDYE